MAGLLIRDIPPELHERLKEAAQKHHRSISKEALAILEDALADRPKQNVTTPRPIKAKVPLTQEFLDYAKREGRL